MKLLRSYKVRLLPNKVQEQKLKDYCGLQRFVYNSMLEYCMDCYDQSNLYIHKKDVYECFKQFTHLITIAKKTTEYQWLKQFSRHTIMNIQRDLKFAYEKYFKFQDSNDFLSMIKNKKLTNKLQYKHHPQFKKKKNDKKISIPFDADEVYNDGNEYIKFPKLGRMKFQLNKKSKFQIPKGTHMKVKEHKNYILNPRIKFINNKWILCFVMEIDSQDIQLNIGSVIGIDLGIKHLCAVSKFNGQSVLFKNINKELKRIKRLEIKKIKLQQSISRKYRTFKRFYPNQKFIRSNSFNKVVKQLDKVYYHLSCIRKDYLDWISKQIVNQLPETIVLEDLDLSFMIKNHKLAKYELDQSLGLFRNMIKYKAEELGIKIILVDKTYPSSQFCSNCGHKQKMPLNKRIYKCPMCGMSLDRDINASLNLQYFGEQYLSSY